ncbi:hypothetical protein DIPPA_33604 [Diplonema papillatum]|nr:hypothetical protein DIPPA_33604 [Diplonema papillatum]KAJ9459499.1 hypothetical protein DIPPA_33604 [Diplonema papillatum]
MALRIGAAAFLARGLRGLGRDVAAAPCGVRRRQRRGFRGTVEVPSDDDMMALLHGHQVDVAWDWIQRGVPVCWLGDFGVLMAAYDNLDVRIEAEFVKGNGNRGASSWKQLTDLCAAKKVLHRLWAPNPISVLSNSFNDEGFQQWVESEYPPANFRYLPVPVFAHLLKTYRRFTAGRSFPCLGRSKVVVKLGHCVDPTPLECPPAKLLRNYLAANLSASATDEVASLRGNQRVLIPEAGALSGLLPLVVLSLSRFRGHVHVLDPVAECMKSIQLNWARLRTKFSKDSRRFRSLKHEVQSGVLPRNLLYRYNLAIYCPPWLADRKADAAAFEGNGYFDLRGQHDDYDWLPTGRTFGVGTGGGIEAFFDNISTVLDADATVIVLWSNLANIVSDTDAHPVVAELEKNDRFHLAHFEDVPFPPASAKFLAEAGHPLFAELNRRMRAELWVLKVNRLLLPAPPLAVLETGLVPVDEREEAKEDKKKLIRYFHPPDEFMGDYEQTRVVFKADKTLSQAPKPTKEGLAEQKLLLAQHHQERVEKERKRNLRDKLAYLGVGKAKPPRPRVNKVPNPFSKIG